MHYRPFGKQGSNCSEIGFGAWAIGGSWGTQADTFPPPDPVAYQ
jgi:aryl-alcohol dehydrogenase-like predicted oxidoreductase